MLFGYFWTHDEFDHLSSRYRTTQNLTEYFEWQELVGDIERLTGVDHAQASVRLGPMPWPEAERTSTAYLTRL
jgi:hypothetical protein